MKKVQYLSRAVSLAIMIVGLGARTAHAVDAKVFPGSMCVQTSTAGQLGYVNNGWAVNKDTIAPVNVACSIVRDVTAGLVQTAGVVVLDSHSTANVSCSFKNQDITTSAVYTSATVSSSATGKQTLPFSVSTQYAGGSYVLACTIPPKTSSGQISGIILYWVEEP